MTWQLKIYKSKKSENQQIFGLTFFFFNVLVNSLLRTVYIYMYMYVWTFNVSRETRLFRIGTDEKGNGARRKRPEFRPDGRSVSAVGRSRRRSDGNSARVNVVNNSSRLFAAYGRATAEVACSALKRYHSGTSPVRLVWDHGLSGYWGFDQKTEKEIQKPM